RAAPDRELAADALRSFLHAEQPEMAGAAGLRDRFLHAAAVVAHDQAQGLALVEHLDLDRYSRGMAQSVAHRLRCDSLDFLAHDGMQCARGAVFDHSYAR